MSQKSSPKITIVNQRSSIQPHQEQQQINPLFQQLQQMKITSNLIKQINFNTAANKFEYLEQLLSEEYRQFSHDINQLSARQRQIVTKQMKNLNRDIGRILASVQKQKQPSSRNLLANKSELLDLHKRAQTVIETKKSSEKFLKLSEGMLNAVEKLEIELDEHVKGKIQEHNMEGKK